MFAISRRLYCMPATTNYTLSHVLFIRVGKNEGTLSFMIAEVDCKLLMSMIFRNRPTTKNRKQQKPVGMLVAPPIGGPSETTMGKSCFWGTSNGDSAGIVGPTSNAVVVIL